MDNDKILYRFEDVKIRKFCFEDIPLKIKWINSSKNNQYLGYDLPLEYEKTCNWFNSVKDRKDRLDTIIEYKGKPVGMVGLLNIDYKNLKAEDYSLIGEDLKGLGIGTKAGKLLFVHAYYTLGLNKIYGTIEVDNKPSLNRWFRLGGHVEGYLREERWKNGKPVDVYFVAHYKKEFSIPKEAYKEEKLENDTD